MDGGEILTPCSHGRDYSEAITLRSEIAMEVTILLATAALVLLTWLLYKLAEWLEPRR